MTDNQDHHVGGDGDHQSFHLFGEGEIIGGRRDIFGIMGPKKVGTLYEVFMALKERERWEMS